MYVFIFITILLVPRCTMSKTANDIRSTIKSAYEHLRTIEIGRDELMRNQYPAILHIGIRGKPGRSATIFAPNPPTSTNVESCFILRTEVGVDIWDDDINPFLDRLLKYSLSDMILVIPNPAGGDTEVNYWYLNWKQH